MRERERDIQRQTETEAESEAYIYSLCKIYARYKLYGEVHRATLGTEEG